MKRILPIALMGLTLAACSDDVTEIARAHSPELRQDVVIGKIKAGSAEPYIVSLVKPGENVGKGQRLLVADQMSEQPSVSFENGHVVISCQSARVWSYRNFWINADSTVTIPVELKCGTQGWKPSTKSSGNLK